MAGITVTLTASVAAFQTAMRTAEARLEHFQQTARRTTDALSEIAMPAAAAFASLTLGVAAATKSFGDFEAVLNQTRAVSGATAAEMESLKQQALDLGASTAFSAKEAAQAQAELSKSGMQVNQVLAATPGVMSLAAAGALDVGRAAEITGAALNGFGLQAEQAGYVADLLAKAANASALDVSDVGESLKYVAPIAASTSQSIEEVATVLAIMGNAGIKGSQGGTVARSAIASLAKPSDEAAKQLHKLKISIQDTSGNMLPLTDIIGQLRTNTAKLSEVQRANAIATIFGTEAMSGIMAIMKQAPEQVAAVATQFNNVSGASADMAQTMNSGFKGAMDQMSGSIDTAATLLGEQLAPAVMQLAKWVGDAADAFTKLDPGTKTMIAGATAAAIALTGMVAVLSGVALALPAITAGFTLMSGALAPVIIGIGTLAAGVSVLTVALNRQTGVSNQTASSLQSQQAKVDALTQEYEALAAKTSKTADEKKRLAEVLRELDALAPGVAGGFDAMGNAQTVNRDALDKYNGSLSEQIRLLQELEAQNRLNAIADRDRARFQLYASQQELKNLEKQLAQAQVDTPTRSYDPSGRTAPVESNRVGELRSRIAGMQKLAAEQAKALRDSEASFGAKFGPRTAPAKPAASGGGTPRTRGAAVAAPEKKGKGGKSEAEKAADEAHKKAVERIQKLNQAFQDNLTVARAWGGGTAAEVEGLTDLIGRLRSQGLDKVPEGYDLIRQSVVRLRAIQGEQGVKAIEDAKALGKAMDEGSTSTKGFMDGFGALFGSLDTLKEKNDAWLDLQKAEAFRAGIQEIQGDVTALAIDPSLERIANFARDLSQDPEKLKQYGTAINGIGEAFSKAKGEGEGFGGMVDGIGGALGSIVSNINPVSMALTVVVQLAAKIQESFEAAAAAQRRAIEQAKELREEIEDNEIALAEDPGQRAAMIRDRDIRKAQEKLNKDLSDKRKELFDAAIAKAWADNPKDAQAAVRAQDAIRSNASTLFSDEKILEANPLLKQKYVTDLQVAWKNFGDTIDDINANASKVPAEGAKAFKSAVGDAGEALEELSGKVAEAQEKAADIREELNRGGRDDWGRKISLAAEKTLSLEKQRTANADRLNDLTEQKLKLETDLAKLAEDERRAIQEIENEGIAMRSVTEAQDKAARIEKVRTDYASKRTDLNDELAKNEQAIKDAQLEAEQAISRINIQYDERIETLKAELKLQQDITKELQRQKEQAASSGSSDKLSTGRNGDTSGSLYNQDGKKVWYVKKDGTPVYHAAASGGMVAGGIPGKDSVPVMAMPGQVIVSEPVTRGIKAMVNAYQRGEFGRPAAMAMPQMPNSYQSQVVTVGDIHIHAAPGMDERQLANLVRKTVANDIRRSGAFR